MRVKVTETPVYTWDELSPKAKDNAREAWSRFLWEDGSANESMELIWSGTLEDAGWSDLSDLTYNLYQQGGYPEWSGRVTFVHDGVSWNASVKRGRVEWVERDDEEEADGIDQKRAEDALSDLIAEWSSDLFWKFRAEDDYMTSDEQMAETAEANGYEYTEDGELA